MFASKHKYNLIILDLIPCSMKQANPTYSLGSFLFHYISLDGLWMLLLLCEKQQPVSRRGRSSLEQIIRRERTTMPPPRCCLSGMPSSRSACQAHAGAQAGRKRQSFWKTRVWSEPTQRSCQAQQLWPASASASLVLAGTRQTSGERMQPSGDH